MEAQNEDLKESVRIKMSVADDLQNLLKASRQQNQDIRDEQKQLQHEKQRLEYDLMQSRHELTIRNETILQEIDSIQQSIFTQTNEQSASLNSERNNLQSSFNPFLTKLKTILKNTSSSSKKEHLTTSRAAASIEANSYQQMEDDELERQMKTSQRETVSINPSIGILNESHEQEIPVRDSETENSEQK